MLTIILLFIFIIVHSSNKTEQARQQAREREQARQIIDLKNQVEALNVAIAKLENKDSQLIALSKRVKELELAFFGQEMAEEMAEEKTVALANNAEVVISQPLEVVEAKEKEVSEVVASAPLEKEVEYSTIEVASRKPTSLDLIFSEDAQATPKKPKFKIKSENWVGVNLLNRLGALLIVVGAISAANLGILPPVIRSIILFVFAVAVIIVGEIMNRKKPTIASMGVTAVGVALLYVAVAMSYFGLQVLGMYSALIACILTTGLGVYLAIRYDEQVVGCFALVGGYLPILAVDPVNQVLTIGIVIYFLILSVYSLSIALARKWTVMNVIGFILTIIGTSYLGWYAEPLTALLYACFAFFLYIILPLLTACRTKETFNEFDVIFTSINAFVSSTIIFLIADRLNIVYMLGLLSLVFAGVYIGLAHFIRKKFEHQNMETIFKLTSIAFTVLFVPFYFDARWFAIAWLAEAVVIAAYGILREKKISEFTGLGLLGFSAGSLLLYNLALDIEFTFNYSFFTIAVLIVLGVYVYKGRQQGSYPQVYKIVALTNLWIFTLYALFTYVTDFNMAMTLAAVMTLILAGLHVKMKILSDHATHVLANVMHGASMVGIWISLYTYEHAYTLVLNLVLMAIMVAMVLYYKATEIDSKWVKIYKVINLGNFWLSSSLILCILLFDEWLSNIYFAIAGIGFVVITLLLSLLYVKSRWLADKGVRILVNIMHATSLSILWFSGSDFAWRHHTRGGYYFGLASSLFLLLIAVIMVVYYQVKEGKSKWVKVYKNINLINLWLFTLFIVGNLLQSFDGYQIILILITFVGALLVTRLSIIRDEQTTIISIVMHSVGLIWLAIFNASTYQPFFVWLFLNSTTQIVALVALDDLIKLLTPKEKESSFKLLIVFTYFLFVVTQGLMVQGDVGFNSGLISIIYVVAAFIWIILGFKLKNKVLRKCGLYLSVASVVKLLVVDTWGLSTEMRIVSYLTLGFVLMLISFVYQRFSRKLDDNQSSNNEPK